MDRRRWICKRTVWVVEIFDEGNELWYPTVGVGITREDGRAELKKWAGRNCDKFRLRKYAAEEPQ